MTRLEYVLAWTILKGLGLLPRPLAITTAQTLAGIIRRLMPHLSRHAEINLKLAFPELSPDDRARLKRQVFATLGRLLGEVSQFPRLNRQNISDVVAYDGLENFLAARDLGRGVLLLTGHVGSWELSVFSHAIYGYPMSFLARRVDNPLVERLVETYRSRVGNISIDKRGAVREVLRTLREGGVVGILADLNTTREEGVFVDFFGIQSCTTPGVASLALRSGAAVVPVYIVWDEESRIHKLCFEPALEIIDTGNRKADTIANTARYAKVLESIIRRYPGQWLWIHRRWRTRPEGEPTFY